MLRKWLLPGLLLLAAPVVIALSAADAQALVCAQNYQLVAGACVLKQNCGANAYRSPEGDCYCKRGYRMTSGKCLRLDARGFEIEPWKKPGCATWKSQCAQGSAAACTRFETTCQVN